MRGERHDFWELMAWRPRTWTYEESIWIYIHRNCYLKTVLKLSLGPRIPIWQKLGRSVLRSTVFLVLSWLKIHFFFSNFRTTAHEIEDKDWFPRSRLRRKRSSKDRELCMYLPNYLQLPEEELHIMICCIQKNFEGGFFFKLWCVERRFFLLRTINRKLCMGCAKIVGCLEQRSERDRDTRDPTSKDHFLSFSYLDWFNDRLLLLRIS